MYNGSFVVESGVLQLLLTVYGKQPFHPDRIQTLRESSSESDICASSSSSHSQKKNHYFIVAFAFMKYEIYVCNKLYIKVRKSIDS